MARIPKNRTINIPAGLWGELDDEQMGNRGTHLTKKDVIKILEHVAGSW